MSLHWADYVILVTFMMTSLGIGVYHALTGGRQKTTEEFIMANRDQKILPTALSLVVSYISALIVLGSTAEMYMWGTHMWVIINTSVALALLLTERLVVPWLYPLKLLSIFEYFELRFHSKTVRMLASCLGITWSVLYMGIAIYAPSVALQSATQFPIHFSIPIMVVVSTIYTAIGGMRAVVWTDVFQFCTMMAGLLAVLIKGSLSVGGISKVYETNLQGGRLIWYNLDPNPTTRATTWAIFGSTFNYMYTYGFQQASFQRFTATQSIRNSRMIMLLTIVFSLMISGLSSLIGLVVYAYYSLHDCDPINGGLIDNGNQLVGLFVKTLFTDSKGFMGFFLVVLYSGSLSSVSSCLSGAAANTWEDILKWKLPSVSDHRATLFNKALVVVYGVVAGGIAVFASKMPGPITQICDAFLGAAAGPLLGMFLLGGIFKSSEWIGVTIGGLTSLVVCMWICLMGSTVFHIHNHPLPAPSTNGCFLQDNTTSYYPAATSLYTTGMVIDPTALVAPEVELHGIQYVYGVSFLWYGLIGTILCVIVGLLVSIIVNIITKKGRPAISPELLIQWRNIYRCHDPKSSEYSVANSEERDNKA